MGLDAIERARLEGATRGTGDVRPMGALQARCVVGNERNDRVRRATERAADALLRLATETIEEKRGRVALAAAHLLHDGAEHVAFNATLATAATLEAMSAHATETHLSDRPAPRLALALVIDGERALSAVRELLAEVCR